HRGHRRHRTRRHHAHAAAGQQPRRRVEPRDRSTRVMTDIDVYQAPAGIGQYQAGIIMTPESAKALDEQVRRCTEAVLREGTDYGIIPGTGGDQTLWRP